MSNEPWSHDAIVSELLSIIREQKQLDEAFTAQSDLAAAGLDSLTLVRILVAIEEKFGVWLEGEDLTSTHLQNVETMATRLEKLLQSQSAS